MLYNITSNCSFFLRTEKTLQIKTAIPFAIYFPEDINRKF